VPVSFLLNATDDTLEFITEKDVGMEPDGVLLGPIRLKPPHAWRIRSQDEEMLDFLDPTLLLPSFEADLAPYQLGDLPNTEDNDILSVLLSSRLHGDRLAARIELLESHLDHQFRSNNRYRSLCDATAFRRFFTVSNVHKFAATFCRKRHYQYPLIHWPTFILEEAPLPLLMAVALTGATYSYCHGKQPKHVNSARHFYCLADAYIFDELDALGGPSASEIDEAEAIQVCQAALLMYGLNTLVSSNASMQYTSVTQRLPALVSAMRRLDFAGCKHDPSEDWQLFLRKEKVIRLVSWAFCADSLATLSYDNPPLFSVFEMTGDLPCDPALWDIESESDFRHANTIRRRSSHSLKNLMSSFLDDTSQLRIDHDSLPLSHLHVLVCGEYPFAQQSRSV
jgi:hypothetical protein